MTHGYGEKTVEVSRRRPLAAMYLAMVVAWGGCSWTGQDRGELREERGRPTSGGTAAGPTAGLAAGGPSVGASASAPAGRSRRGGGGSTPVSSGGDMDPAAGPTSAPAADMATSARGDEPEAAATDATTVTVESGGAPSAGRQQYRPVPRMLTAASVADVDRRGNYLAFLSRHPYEARRVGLDMTRRIRFRVVDSYGRPVHDARITLHGRNVSVEGRTHADGYWDFHPGVSAPRLAGRIRARVSTERLQGEAVVDVPARGDGQDVVIELPGAIGRPSPALDLAFLIDATGSMGDELRYVNREIGDIVRRVRSAVPEVSVRVGAVFYRDRSDPVRLRRIDFTADVDGFAARMRSVRASGGGDYREDMNAGLEAGLHKLSWRDEQRAVRVLVTIADAPPKRYGTQFGYRTAMTEASRRGIRLLPVAASSANREVEYLFRAMGAFTSTPYVYLTDDSGIGNPHLEADTDRVAVEYFNDLLTRMVVADLRGEGMHEPGPFGPDGSM